MIFQFKVLSCMMLCCFFLSACASKPSKYDINEDVYAPFYGIMIDDMMVADVSDVHVTKINSNPHYHSGGDDYVFSGVSAATKKDVLLTNIRCAIGKFAKKHGYAGVQFEQLDITYSRALNAAYVVSLFKSASDKQLKSYNNIIALCDKAEE